MQFFLSLHDLFTTVLIAVRTNIRGGIKSTLYPPDFSVKPSPTVKPMHANNSAPSPLLPIFLTQRRGR